MLDHKVETFLALCQTMNYTRAAEQLHITQPAVSQHIRALEAEYGARFFAYEGKQLSLTEAGTLFLRTASAARHDDLHLKELLRAQAGRHTLHFGATLTIGEYLMPGPLSRLLRTDPDLRLRMVVNNTDALLAMLDRGENIHVPKYEFARQMRSDILSQPLKLGPDELAIFEGIHALNDVIVGKNPKAFKLYIAARSNVVDEDGAVVFQHPWLRLCRRIVRDYKFRGSDANFTLKMWPNVRRGEKLYISPYKENADLMFDSSLPDEVAVLKPFVVPLLEALPQGKYEIADDILRGFERIEIMEESNIAPSSLVREFIGGSIYPS